MIGGRLLKIAEHQYSFMGYLVRRAMTAVIHDKSTIGHISLQQTSHLWITIACRSGSAGLSIPHHSLHIVSRIVGLYDFCHIFSLLHVDITVTVISHHHNGILPVTGIGIGIVRFQFIYHRGGFGGCAHWISTYSHIGLSTIASNIFPIIQQAVEVITDITIYLTERILALITQQEIIR